MKKRLSRMMAVLMAAALVFSVPVVSRAADDPETVDSAGANHWGDWVTDGPRSQDYAVGADGTLVLYVQGMTSNDDFIMEVTDGTNFISANTQPDADKNEGVWATESGVTCKVENGETKGLKTTNVIKLTVKSQKSGSTKSFIMDLYDTVTKKTLMAFSAVGSSMADTWSVHIVSVFGGVKIYSKAPDGVDTSGGGDTQITTPPTGGGNQNGGNGSETELKTMKLSGVKVKKGAKKITGKVSVKKATVKIKVGKKKYKKAKVSGKKFTFKTSKLKKKTKVTIKVTKSGYKTLTKTYKVK